MKTIIYLILILISYSANSQSLHIFDIDTTDFPTMRAKFWAFDEEGKQITNLSPSDFELTENGEVRTITDISCSEPTKLESVSVAISLDISASMGYRNMSIIPIELGKSLIRELCLSLETPPSEIALQQSNYKSYILQDFTVKKNKIITAMEPIQVEGHHDYVNRLLNPFTGLLLFSGKGKYKKIAIVYTDARGSALSKNELQECKTICSQYDIEFYSVIYSHNKPGFDGIKSSLRDLVNFTGGFYFDGITNEKQAIETGKKLQQIIQGNKPCSIEWLSSNCTKGIKKLELYCHQNEMSTYSSYKYPITLEAKLEFNPPYLVRFQNPPIGKLIEKKLSVTARHNTFKISDIETSNPNFKLTPSEFTLQPDESKELNLSYNAQDSNNYFCTFDIKNNVCKQEFYAGGGYIGNPTKEKTLKLTYPKGGEKFVIGSDVKITWEGVSPLDTVRLDFSDDNGETWHIISHKALGLSYEWKSIPSTFSDNCLIKVSQGEFSENYNPNLSEPQIAWQKTYGGSKYDIGNSIIQLNDSSLVVVGETNSTNGDVEGNIGEGAIWLLNLNKNDGSLIWQKTYGGKFTEKGSSVIETKDSNIVIAGQITSHNKNLSEGAYGVDFWVLKLNKNDGSIIWEKTIGGSQIDYATSIIELNDGSLVVTGTTNTNSVLRSYDYLVTKLNQHDGSIVWKKTLGGSKDDIAYSIIESFDGSIVVAGTIGNNRGDVTIGKGKSDIWITKLSSIDGSIIWEKTVGGEQNEIARSIKELKDGTLVLAGWTESTKGDITKNNGTRDVWVAKINQIDGSIIWQKSLGGKDWDEAYSIIEAYDGSLTLAGVTRSINGDISKNNGYDVAWVVNLNQKDGLINWENTYGGTISDKALSIIELDDKSLVFSGVSYSNDGDLTENKGYADLWVVKLFRTSVFQSDVCDTAFSIVNSKSQVLNINMGKVLVSNYKDSVVVDFVSNVGSYPFTVDSIYFTGEDSGDFSLISGFPNYQVEPSNSQFGEFLFFPNRVGLHTAEIVVITQSDTLIQSIVGEGIERNIAVIEDFIDFGQVYEGEFKDTLQTVTIKNVGSTPFTINQTKHSYPNDIDFTTLDGGGNFTLQPDETHQMELRFAPSDVGRTSGVLEFHYDGVGSPAVIQLFGEGIQKDTLPEINPLPDVISIKSISPNPATNNLEIVLNLIEKGKTQLAIYNTNGIKVKSIFNENITEIGEKIYNVSTSTLSGGKYFVVLITPTYSEKKNLVIVR